MVLLDPTGSLMVGAAAEHQAAIYPDRVERTPKRYLGGATPLLLGGMPVPPVSAIARLIKVFLDEGRLRNQGRAPEQVALTHPVRWGADRKEALEAAAAEIGSPHPLLIPEPVAAAVHYAMDDTGVGQYVGVYDLGGGTFDTAILRRTEDGFETVGAPGGDEFIGGESFDHLVYEQLGEIIAADDPGVWEEMQYGDDRKWLRAAADLMTQARRIKEAVSSYPSAQALLPVLERETVFTRSALETLIRPHIEHTIEEMVATVSSAGLQTDDLAALYLVGGSSRIPLVTRLMTEAFGDRVTTRDEPKGVVALGAAVIAQRATDPRLRGPSGRFRPLWSSAHGTAVSAVSADAAGVVAVSSDRIASYRRDGVPLWTAAVPSPPTSGIARAPGLIGIGCGSTMVLLGEQGGNVYWAAEVRGRILAPPVFAPAGVLVADDRGTVAAIAGATGAVTWMLPVGKAVTSGIAVTGSAVLVAAGNIVYRVDIGTGVVTWGFPAPADVAAVLVASPVSAVVVCVDGAIYAIDSDSGAARWGARAPSAAPEAAAVRQIAAAAALVPGGQLLLVADVLGRLHGVELEAGAIRWSAPAAPVASPVAATSVRLVIDGTLAHMAMPNGVLASVSTADGTVVARAQVHNGPLTALDSVGGQFVLGAGDRVMAGALEQ